MGMHRFFIPPEEWQAGRMALQGAEAHHCAEVLRHRVGDKVVLFNGAGQEATAQIESLDKYRVELRVQGVLKGEPLPARLILGQAIPKGRRMELILQKATELGAGEIIPILAERSVVRLDPEEARRKHAKWERQLLEACKQSGQNWAPVLRPPVSLPDLIETGPLPAELCLVASLQPGARSLHEILAEHVEMHGARPRSAMVLIGPEGDFTPAELARAVQSGFHPMTLGPIVLRTDTAAIYSLSVLAYELLRPAE